MIATTLLEWLTVGGRSAARTRASRALGADLGTAPAWLADDAVATIFAAGEVDASLARAIGHRLMAPDATGLRLYGLGLATPEKAYRRVQSLLPREAALARWSVEEIAGRSARLRFEAAPIEDPAAAAAGRCEEALCGLRRGMLEAIPGLYGLLPAVIRETSCRAKGSDACLYEVNWQVASRSGAIAGLAIGVALAAGFVASLLLLGGMSILVANSAVVATVAALSVFVLAPALGWIVDLQCQLEAVAGARRGHLALFDQVDDALAAKLDALARADAKLESEASVGPFRRAGAGENEGGVSPEDRRGILTAAQQIHATAGDLECLFEADAARCSAARESGISDERGLVREIREWAARIEKLGSSASETLRTRVGPVALVDRAIASMRPTLAPSAVIEVDADPELRCIECEPIQIEFVVAQLVQNAVEASIELNPAPEVRISLANDAHGVALAVEDRGVGIESSEVDEAFDPFFGDRPAGASGGLGLAVCLRIIERHGGELRIENEDRAGTRVSVWLPESTEEDAE
ncbi:MAG: hypothetical protein GY910_20340 [bacterium]|nr:hypothetical protein [bacterium]